MTDRSDSDAILKRIGIILPASAKVKYADYTAGMDDAARVSLEMSQADWTAFLRRLVEEAPRPPEFSDDADFALGTAKPGWNPEGVKGLKTGEFSWRKETEALNVGYVPVGNGDVRVFLFWHQL